MIRIAKELAKEKFAGLTDLAGDPYYNHLERVWLLVKESGGDLDQQTIAILHDILEDTPVTMYDLEEFFNRRVVRAVFDLTRKARESYDEYIGRIRHNDDCIIVKLADLRDNMDVTRLNSITDKDVARLIKYHKAYKALKNQ